jgi:hypothetical protein
MKRYEALAGYELAGCAIRRWNIIAFWGQQWDNPDPLDVRPTRVFFYYPDEPAEAQWAHRDPGRTRGFRGCATAIPDERWVFVADDGEVYVVGGGVDAFESPITGKPFSFFSNVKRVDPGRAIAVGPRRKVFVRQAPNNWLQLAEGLFPEGEQNLDTAGFSDIDAFSPTDMYACGGRGDLWHFDGNVWIQIDVPTNDNLRRLCCASNGIVYVLTGRGQLLTGRNQIWSVISQDLTNQPLESIVDFRGRVVISTQAELFEMADNTFQPAALGNVPPMRSRSFLAVGDGILLVAGSSDACSFDGTTWSVIIPSA